MKHETVEMEISVSELRLGMHVIRLDRPWEETDFLLQGFIINRQEDIDALQAVCRTVVIEGKVINRSPASENHGHAAPIRNTRAQIFFSDRRQVSAKKIIPPKNQLPGNPGPHRRVTYINKIDVGREIQKATGHYEDAKSVAHGIMSGLRVGRALDINKARAVVNDCVESLLRNDDALLLLTKLKHKDEYTAEHCLNVAILSAAFGKKLGLLEEEIKTLGLCGLLHDIGKSRVPNEILQKPGPLSPDEFGIMRKHADWGRDILMSQPRVVHAAVDVAYNHHERLDGKGYPRGLVDYQIPYYAKIVAIVDAYDAITSNRAYDHGRSSMEALQIIHRFSGKQFDAELAKEFISMIGIYPPGSIVEMISGEVAIVIASNPKNRRKPKIMLVRDAEKVRLPKYRLLDLASSPIGSSGEPLTIKKEVPDGTYGIVLQRFIDNGLVLGHQVMDESSR